MLYSTGEALICGSNRPICRRRACWSEIWCLRGTRSVVINIRVYHSSLWIAAQRCNIRGHTLGIGLSYDNIAYKLDGCSARDIGEVLHGIGHPLRIDHLVVVQAHVLLLSYLPSATSNYDTLTKL